jgi:hypothetical protein
VPDPDPHHFDGDHDGIGCGLRPVVRVRVRTWLRFVAILTIFSRSDFAAASQVGQRTQGSESA